MKHADPNAIKVCPLYKKEIYWAMCYEVQEVREDSMDMALLPEPFDLNAAQHICEQCKWYKVTDF